MATNATMADLAKLISKLETKTTYISQNNDVFFLVTMSIIIYFMQCGFAFLECGAVRSKNTTNILIKNILDSFVGGVAYWTIGYAFAFGKSGNGFISWEYFASHNLEGVALANWFFHFVFAATAATIVSGAVAERCDFFAYFSYSFVITGFIYPIAAHWAWSGDGWLAAGLSYDEVIEGTNITISHNIPYQDFAGSGVVHLLGGAAALVGAAVMGPRIGRFEGGPEGQSMKGHSVPLAAMGGFILFFGFFAFNGGSQASISAEGDGAAVCLAMVNTIISASFAALTALLLRRTPLFGDNKWSILVTINGALTGMVAICSGCNSVYPWGAAIIGVISAFTFLAWSYLVAKLKIDDPLDAVAVHMGGGIWGLIATPILRRPDGVDTTGIVFNPAGKEPWMGLAWNLAGLVSIAVWSLGCAAILFLILKFFKVLRVPAELELRGLDIPKHGEPAYPAEAYGHGWDTDGVSIEKIVNEAMVKLGKDPQDETVRDVIQLVGQAIQSQGHFITENPEAYAIMLRQKHAKGFQMHHMTTPTFIHATHDAEVGSREIKTCPGAKGITGGCPGGGIIKLKSLIVGANIRSPEVSCGQFRPKDCRDLKHTFKFYTFVQFDASRFDESVAVPGFESTCYDENLVQNKYIHLKYACITDANGGRISAECYNGGPSLLQLTEPHNEMTESKNSTKTTATTTPITTIFQGITSITNEIETPAKFENTTANTAPSKNEISEQDAEFTTQSGVTTENVTNGNGTLQGTLMREQFVVDEAVIIGPVVVAIVIILLILIIIFFVKRRRGMQCVCTQVPKSHDSDAIELESTTISHPDGGLHNAPDADINESNQSSNNMEHVTENYHNVYATADESRVRLPPEGMSIDGDYDAIAIQVENDKLNNLVPSVDDYKSKRIEQHGDTNKINHLSTQSDTNPINQITAIEPVVRDSECSKTSTNDLYTHVKKQDIKSKQIKTVDTQGDIPKNPKVPEKTWGDQTYSDVTLSKGNINGEFVRESQMVENEIYNDSVIPPCYQTENALSKHINLTHDENTTVRESQMIENDLYNDVNVDNNIEKFPGLGTSVGEDINATNERDIPVRANQMIDNDIYNDTSTKQSQDFEKTKMNESKDTKIQQENPFSVRENQMIVNDIYNDLDYDIGAKHDKPSMSGIDDLKSENNAPVRKSQMIVNEIYNDLNF
ncbi:unnamed protein product [Owenia fusiformis]|uniref:Ammonium transporter AmtB-like domain-containing protein n=1 Tax=Owenia fusiformis TaxID=6347 RepID=A0A8S4NIV1_OWEFU|nr:unnamed protein product [Owenia fusiformis]